MAGTFLELKLVNKSPDKKLVVDGEELMGAKQNAESEETLCRNIGSDPIGGFF